MAIEIPTLDELTFEERRHIYRLNGIEIPSVTTLMKPLSAEVYGDVDPDVLDKAARRGTAVHNATENYAKFGIMDIEPDYEPYLMAFVKWWKRNNPVLLGSECRVYHKQLGYAGTSDLLCLIGDQVVLVDYKTSYQVNSMLCAVQLEGYDRAWESHGVKIDERKILHLKRDGNGDEIDFPRSMKCWKVLNALLTVRNYVNSF